MKWRFDAIRLRARPTNVARLRATMQDTPVSTPGSASTSRRQPARRPAAFVITCWAFCSAVWGAQASTAAAQPVGDDSARSVARQLGAQGVDAYRANDFASAEAKLDRAFHLFPTPTLGLWSARARVQLGDWVEAAERFLDATRTSDAVGDSTAQKQAQRDAANEREALLPRIPNLTVTIEHAKSSEVTILLDGSAVPVGLISMPRPTNPGAHRLVATRGSERYETAVELGEREQKTVLFTFRQAQSKAAVVPLAPVVGTEHLPPTAAPSADPSPATAASSSTRSVLMPVAIVAMSVGVVGLATSGITALVANGKLDDCPNHQCTTSDAKQSYDTLKTVSTVSLFVGAGLAVGGLVTWLMLPSAQEHASGGLSWSVAPTSVALRGAF